MALVRVTAEEARQRGRVDAARVEATTEDEIRQHMIEDGLDPDESLGPVRVVYPAAVVRAKTGLSQDKFAQKLGIPAKTIRNWEQGRTVPDPASRALLRLVEDDPERAFRVLAPK